MSNQAPFIAFRNVYKSFRDAREGRSCTRSTTYRWRSSTALRHGHWTERLRQDNAA